MFKKKNLILICGFRRMIQPIAFCMGFPGHLEKKCTMLDNAWILYRKNDESIHVVRTRTFLNVKYFYRPSSDLYTKYLKVIFIAESAIDTIKTYIFRNIIKLFLFDMFVWTKFVKFSRIFSGRTFNTNLASHIGWQKIWHWALYTEHSITHWEAIKSIKIQYLLYSAYQLSLQVIHFKLFVFVPPSPKYIWFHWLSLFAVIQMIIIFLTQKKRSFFGIQ